MKNGGSDKETYASLEWKLLFSILASGRSAKATINAMRRLIRTDQPFFELWSLIEQDGLMTRLIDAKVGGYERLEPCLRSVIKYVYVDKRVDLRECAPKDLEVVYGIGPKTSRHFILWTQPGAQYAVLEVHVMKWLRGLGYAVPETTPPPGVNYQRVEKIFLSEAKRLGMTAKELDDQLLSQGARLK
jgi:thermostable 8-oxoguanine DNA glycosylase